eukprot:292055-Pelagomonas_calceolata.AAC.1
MEPDQQGYQEAFRLSPLHAVQNVGGVGPSTVQHFGSLTWLMISASHGVKQGVSWCCGAEHTFGVCAHVCFFGATHMSVNPLVAVHGTYIATLASMELYTNVA